MVLLWMFSTHRRSSFVTCFMLLEAKGSIMCLTCFANVIKFGGPKMLVSTVFQPLCSATQAGSSFSG